MRDMEAAAIWEERKSRETRVKLAERGREKVRLRWSDMKPMGGVRVGWGWVSYIRMDREDWPITMRPAQFVRLMAETWDACQRAASAGSYGFSVSRVEAR
jgi:hypothetical protein